MATQLDAAGQGGCTLRTLGIVVALATEYRALKRHFHFGRPTKRQIGEGTVPFSQAACGSGSVVVVRAGVGPANAAGAAGALVEHHQPDGLLCVGLAGALGPELKPCDVIVASDTLAVPDPTLGEPGTASPCASDPVWHDLAMRLAGDGRRAFSGRVVTSPRVILRADRKRQLGETYNALAVDMESAAVAAVARDHGRPFLALRAVSDDANGDLPEILARWSRAPRAEGSEPHGGRMLPSPHEAAQVVRLGIAARRAAEQLADLAARFARAVLDPNPA